MNSAARTPPPVPPRWFLRAAWAVHRTIVRVWRGRRGLWLPTPKKWGALRLTTIGRTSGAMRSVILGYIEDGPNLVTLAMNGWAEGDPAWWLNLKANPEATVETAEDTRAVRASEATGAERDRIWSRLQDVYDEADIYAPQRATRTAVVILEPR